MIEGIGEDYIDRIVDCETTYIESLVSTMGLFPENRDMHTAAIRELCKLFFREGATLTEARMLGVTDFVALDEGVEPTSIHVAHTLLEGMLIGANGVLEGNTEGGRSGGS